MCPSTSSPESEDELVERVEKKLLGERSYTQNYQDIYDMTGQLVDRVPGPKVYLDTEDGA